MKHRNIPLQGFAHKCGWKLNTVCLGSEVLIAVALKGHSFWYTMNSLLTAHANFLTGFVLETEPENRDLHNAGQAHCRYVNLLNEMIYVAFI
jgi:hypothetical protein